MVSEETVTRQDWYAPTLPFVPLNATFNSKLSPFRRSSPTTFPNSSTRVGCPDGYETSRKLDISRISFGFDNHAGDFIRPVSDDIDTAKVCPSLSSMGALKRPGCGGESGIPTSVRGAPPRQPCHPPSSAPATRRCRPANRRFHPHRFPRTPTEEGLDKAKQKQAKTCESCSNSQAGMEKKQASHSTSPRTLPYYLSWEKSSTKFLSEVYAPFLICRDSVPTLNESLCFSCENRFRNIESRKSSGGNSAIPSKPRNGKKEDGPFRKSYVSVFLWPC